MNTKTKVTLTLFFTMLVLFIVMLINITLHFKEYGIASIENKAESVAETVKDSLTSHMVNGVIANRSLFLEQIGELKNVNKIWIVRAENVTQQYGNGFSNETPKDTIDNEVLKTGKTQKVVNDNIFSESSFRITIPYNATSSGKINCIECHHAKEGETLGAITIELSMDDLKDAGLNTITYTAGIAFVLIIFILLFVNKLINPYLSLFDSIKFVMQEAQRGDYSKRIEETSGQDGQEVAKWINTLLEKLQNTLEEISSKVDIFLTNKDEAKNDPLLDVKKTVNTLSNIYRFRKTIEHDDNLESVYTRLAYVLEHNFGLNDFNFIDADTINKRINIVYTHKNILCDAQIKGCRADLSNTLVDSCQFDKVCDRFCGAEDMEYLCIPFAVSNDMDFIISIVLPNKAEATRVRKLLPYIQDFMDAARPEIVSKKLMSRLAKSARTDPLTGLFNRKYLEESIEKIVSQAKRTNLTFGILMCDIDFFKMINDTHGHDVGDEAIKTIAKTLLENVRDSDIVIRYGGEEFIVILYNCEASFIVDVAEKIRVEFSKKKIKSKNEFFTKTISIGASIFPNHDDNFWKCIKFADLALYEAKHTGRNKVILFDQSLIKDNEYDDKY